MPFKNIKIRTTPKLPFKRGPLVERFWAKVDKRGPDECWPWLGTIIARTGYGNIWTVDRGPINAHRISYEIAYGPVPEGLQVLHSCDNTGCVNAAHLRAGTSGENADDKVLRGRSWRKVQPEAIPRILALRQSGLSYRTIGEMFGVNLTCIHKIVNGQSRSHDAQKALRISPEGQ